MSTSTDSVENRYVIWSHEHQAWWKRARSGYTKRFSDAGVYPRESAMAICTDALLGARHGVPNELPVRLADLEEMQRRSQGATRVLD